MAERPNEYELDDYPERRYGEDTDRPAIGSREEKFFQENSLRGENYKKFRIRQQMIESNRVSVRKSFLKGSQSEVKILKRNILSDVLNIPYDEVDETKFDLKIEPVDIETFKLYNKKGIPLVEYNAKYDRLKVISEDDLKIFKLDYINKISMRYVEKEMKTDFSIKSDLSAIDLEVRQSESEEYHRKIDSLEREVSRLKQVEDDSIEKSRRIEELESEIERIKVNTNDQIENARESLKLKSIQLIESQNEVERLKKNIEKLEDRIRDEKNNDELNKELDNTKKEYNRELNELKKQRDYYQSKEEELRKKLIENIDRKQEDIKILIEQSDRAYKERDESISFQESLKTKISELEKALKKYEDSYAVEKTISEDRKLELDKARDKIKELENEINENMSSNTSMMETHREKVKALKDIIETNKKYIEDQKNSLEEKETYYKDRIEENETEIGSLRFEKETLENRVVQLNQTIEEREDNFGRAIKELARSNREIDTINTRLQELNVENENLNIELEALRSNFGNLIASSEATNTNNTQEILRLNNIIKQLESKEDSVETYVNGLIESIDIYKGILDEANKDKKNQEKRFEEEFDKLNKEKEDLVKDLKNRSKNEDDLKRKLFQNENDYSLLAQKYNNSFSEIDGLMTELNKINEREKILKEEAEYKESRIKAKNDEVTEQKAENEKLKKQIEDLNFNIRNSDFYEQYNKINIELSKTISERNKYIEDLNRSKEDNEELEDEIKVLEKEIEVLKKDRDLAKLKIIPKEILDQMKHDNQELNKQLDVREKQLKEVIEAYRVVKNEHDMAMNNFNNLKKTINKRVNSIKKSYERDLEISRKKLAKTISPGELKALNVFLEDLDIEDYDKVDYDTQIKKLRSAREKFKRLIDDPSTDRAHKLQYKYLDDLMQYRIDFLNIEFKKPIETTKGRDYLTRTGSSWSPLGLVKKIWLAMKDSPGTTASLFLTLASNAAFAVYYFVSTSSNQSKKSVVNVTRKIVQVTRPIRPITVVKKVEPAQKIKPVQKVKPSKKVEPPKKVKPSEDKSRDVVAGGSILYNILSSIPSYALSFAEKIINFIDWTVQNFYKLILSGIIVSVTLYNMYGEQMSFPILAFWSFVLANAVVFATSLTRILPSYIVG